MNEFQDLQDLRHAWSSGNFNYPDRMTVSGIPYNIRSSSTQPFEEIIRDGKNPYIVYTTANSNADRAEEQGLKQWIVMLWGSPDGVIVRPYDIRTTTVARGGRVFENTEVIGDVVLLKIALPSGVVALKGKVDTGADISSLHTDGDPKIVGQTVQFINKQASPNVIQAPLVDKQAVSSADGGVEYRPVIELDVEVNGKPIRGVKFNLNDRSSMEYPVLVGQNILEKTNFVIDPRRNSVREDDEWLADDELELITEDDIIQHIGNVKLTFESTLNESLDMDQICNILDESNVTIKDLFKHVRTKTIERFEDLEY